MTLPVLILVSESQACVLLALCNVLLAIFFFRHACFLFFFARKKKKYSWHPRSRPCARDSSVGLAAIALALSTPCQDSRPDKPYELPM